MVGALRVDELRVDELRAGVQFLGTGFCLALAEVVRHAPPRIAPRFAPTAGSVRHRRSLRDPPLAAGPGDLEPEVDRVVFIVI